MFSGDTNPSTLTSLLVATEKAIPENGSPDSVPSFSLGADGQRVSAAVEIQSTEGGLLLPRMTTAQRDELNPLPGLTIFNLDEDSLSTYDASGTWTLPVAGNVSGPGGPTVIDNIVTWASNDGLLIKDSGVSIAQVPVALLLNNFETSSLATVNVNALENIALLKLDDVTHSGIGGIFVNSFECIKFIQNSFGPVTQICTLFTDDFSDSSTSPSALVELNSTTGALLLSRMSTAQINALIGPQNGMLLHNAETGRTMVREANLWIDILATEPLTLTGAVLGGPASGTIPTTLNTTVSIPGTVANVTQKFVFNSTNSGTFNIDSGDPGNNVTLSLTSGNAPASSFLLSYDTIRSRLNIGPVDFYITEGNENRLIIQNAGVTGDGDPVTIDLDGNIILSTASGSKSIKNLGTPSAGTDAANKAYVDSNLLSTISGAVNGTVTGSSVTTTLAETVECQASTGPILVQKFDFSNPGIAVFNVDSVDSSTPTVISISSGGDPITDALSIAFYKDGLFSQIDFNVTDFHISDNGGNDRLLILNSSAGTGGTITIDADGNMIFP